MLREVPWVCGFLTCMTEKAVSGVRRAKWGGVPDFDLEEVLWRAVDFFEALLASIWHSLHGGQLLVQDRGLCVGGLPKRKRGGRHEMAYGPPKHVTRPSVRSIMKAYSTKNYNW